MHSCRLDILYRICFCGQGHSECPGPRLKESIGPRLAQTSPGPRLPQAPDFPRLPQTSPGPRLPQAPDFPRPQTSPGPRLPQAPDFPRPQTSTGPRLKGSIYTGCIKKVDKSEIALCFAKRLNVRCFLLK